MDTQDTVVYRGHRYRLLWCGETRYGRRAKLQFLDATKIFWVDAAAVGASPTPGAPRRQSGHEMCAECEERRAVTTATDSSGITAPVCQSCARLSSWQRSFA